MSKSHQHTISILVENNSGVLARVAGLFSGRGFNIDSLTVSPTEDGHISKMTIVTNGDDAIIEQIEKQLSKLIEVIAVSDLQGDTFVERELLLIKIKASSETRSELVTVIDLFKGKICNINRDEIMVEVSGKAKKINSFIDLMEPFGIVEMARTGRVALTREPGLTQSI